MREEGVAAMNAYRATARREGNWWIVSVDGVGVTQARRLEHVEEMARDLVATMEGVDPQVFDIDVEIRVNDELDRLRDEWVKLSAEADRLLERARAGKELLMRQLAAARLSARDIGRLTGVSHQRVSQVVGEGGRRARATEAAEVRRESPQPRRLVAQERGRLEAQASSGSISMRSERKANSSSERRTLVATNKKQTSAKAAKSASKVLRDGRTSKSSKAAAGSALSQTPKRRGK